MGWIDRHALERVAERVESLRNTMFDCEGIRSYPYQEACAMAGDEPNWLDLTKGQQRAVMERYVDWYGFTPSDVEHVITNTLAEKPKERWFEGVEIEGEYNKKSYSQWVADEKNPIRAAVRRLNLMRDSQDPDWPGNPLRSGEPVKWADLSEQQKKDLIVFTADRGHRLFSEEYGDMRRRLIDRELGEKPPMHPDEIPMARIVTIEERRALASYEEHCRDNGVTPNDRERTQFVESWLGAASEHRMAGVEAQREDVEGESARWMDGIQADKALSTELEADSRAARAREFGPEDAATYEQRVKEGAESIRHLEPNLPPSAREDLERAVGDIERGWAEPASAEIGRMLADIANPARFRAVGLPEGDPSGR